MRIEIDLPDWSEGRNIWILADREVVARKLKNGVLEVKTVRCNLCGECCRDVDPLRWPWTQVIDVGDTPEETRYACSNLKYERVHLGSGEVREGWFCKLRGDIVPYTCCVGRHEDPEKCVIRFEPVG